jgi:hypothetical protein
VRTTPDGSHYRHHIGCSRSHQSPLQTQPKTNKQTPQKNSQKLEALYSGPSPIQTPQNRHEKNKYMDARFYAIKYHKTDMKQIIHNCRSREIPPFFTLSFSLESMTFSNVS